MVDFKKRLKNKSVPKKVNPVEIYDSLDRRSETGPLRPSQEKILQDWFCERKARTNNIIKLHTGEGKTLIGLLILQSKINSGQGPCLYVCPNKYLAEQVRQEANKFGIPYGDISPTNEFPADFLLGTKILITHVQKVFNGKSIFGLGNKSTEVGAVVLDDSHACIDSIKNALTNEEPRSKLTGYRRVRRVSVVGHLLWDNLAVGHTAPPSASWRARQLSQHNTHPTKILRPTAHA